MIFEENKTIEKLGERSGYVFGYFLFTTILFFVLLSFKKIPSSWFYLHVMVITILITLAGAAINRLLR